MVEFLHGERLLASCGACGCDPTVASVLAVLAVAVGCGAYAWAHRRSVWLALAGLPLGALLICRAGSVEWALGVAALLTGWAACARLADARPWPARGTGTFALTVGLLAALAHPLAGLLFAVGALLTARVRGLVVALPALGFVVSRCDCAAWGCGVVWADACCLGWLSWVTWTLIAVAIVGPSDPLLRDRRPLVTALCLAVVPLVACGRLACLAPTAALLAPLALFVALVAAASALGTSTGCAWEKLARGFGRVFGRGA